MTDLNLRSIAEILKAKFSYSSTAKAKNRFMVCDADGAVLLNAVVEERAKALHAYDPQTRRGWNDMNPTACNYWLTKALDDLNLKDVWPGEEG